MTSRELGAVVHRADAEPLAELRVVDVGTMIAGPMVASVLADFGASVIKVEQPGAGDPIRAWAPHRDDESLWWKVAGRNKRLVTLNLRDPRGRDLLDRMLESADILVENFRPGTLERWGLGPDRLLAAHPSLVMVRISGFGQTGPYKERPGYGTVAEAMSGIPFFTGFQENPPTLSAFPLADSVAGVFGALGALIALRERDARSQRGQVVDVSLFEPLFRLVESQVIAYDQLGHVKQRHGNRMEEDVPRNTYRTKDGKWIVLSASSPRTFERLSHAVGRPDFVVDERFASNTARVAHADELDAELAPWFEARTQQEALKVLLASDVVAGPVYDIRDIFADPQYAARQAIVAVPDDRLGTVRMPGPTPKLTRTPGKVRHAGRTVGYDNEDVFIRELGVSREEFDELRRCNVI